MPRRTSHVPSYRLHKPSGQSRVIINGRHVYLGPYGSEESREKYVRLIAELPPQTVSSGNSANVGLGFRSLSINEVILAYWQYAKGYYVKDGKPTKELACMREALRPVRQLYGHTPAKEFGPRALGVVRQHMTDQRLARTVINQRVSRIKRVFKWAVTEELIPATVHHGLQAVVGLRYGRTEARETEPVKPVPDERVNPILGYVSPQVSAMIQLQRLTGMQPCEGVIMRPGDIDMTGDVWIYEPEDHKNRWRGHRKLIPLGPRAQDVIRPFLNRWKNTYLFSPREAEAWRRERRPVHYEAARKTPIYPSELRARAKAKAARQKRKQKRPKRDHYNTNSYRRAINYGFVKAHKAGVEIPHWHPNQLRHSRGTEIRKQYGIEAAQVVLGHARADVTEVYAEKNVEIAIQIARESG